MKNKQTFYHKILTTRFVLRQFSRDCNIINGYEIKMTHILLYLVHILVVLGNFFISRQQHQLRLELIVRSFVFLRADIVRYSIENLITNILILFLSISFSAFIFVTEKRSVSDHNCKYP